MSAADNNVVISILVPVFNTPPIVLEDMIQSVINQTAGNWELCIVDDASTELHVRDVLDTYKGSDPRIRIIYFDENQHISAASNAAAEFATGDFVAFLDHDDLVNNDVVRAATQLIRSDDEIDFIYTDEDKIEADGRHTESHFKPDFSPEHLDCVSYTLHFMLIRKSLFFRVGGFRDAYSGAQDYDIALRVTRAARKVAHLPGIYYHWRKIPRSAAAVIDAKPGAFSRARAALEQVARREDPQARVVDGLLQSTFRVCWSVGKARPVTIVIPTNCASKDVALRGHINLVANAVRSIRSKSTYADTRILVVDNGNMDESLRRELTMADVRLASYRETGRFNLSRKVNFALSLVETDDVIILNDDIEVITPDWIEALLQLSGRPRVGAVGARLLYPDGRVQHQGVVLGVIGNSAHIFHNLDKGTVGYNGYTHLVRNYSAVTGATLATKMSILKRIGFFDETFAVDYNDVDVCLKIGELGLRIVYTPYAELYHFEGSSLPRQSVNEGEGAAFRKRWQHKIDDDPFYNRHLPRDRADCYLASW